MDRGFLGTFNTLRPELNYGLVEGSLKRLSLVHFVFYQTADVVQQVITQRSVGDAAFDQDVVDLVDMFIRQ